MSPRNKERPASRGEVHPSVPRIEKPSMTPADRKLIEELREFFHGETWAEGTRVYVIGVAVLDTYIGEHRIAQSEALAKNLTKLPRLLSLIAELEREIERLRD